MSKPVDLPPYINENGKRYFLCLTQDIQGHWNVSYEYGSGTALAWSAIGENATPEEALGNLARVYKEVSND